MPRGQALKYNQEANRTPDPFFTLKGEKGEIEEFDQEKILNQFRTSNEIRNVFFTQETFNPGSPQNKIRRKNFINVAFKNTVFENTNFQNCVFESCLLIGTEFRNCEFHDCKFKHCNTHKIRFIKTYIDPKAFTEFPSRVRYANIGVHLFHELYRNSHEMLQPDFKNSAEYEFKKWKRYLLESEWRDKKIGKWEFFKKWIPNVFFFLISGYGLKSLPIITWSLGLFGMVVSFNYHYWSRFDFQSSALNVAQPTFPLALYYTVVTLSTLGYGDITPRSDFGLLMAASQAILGLIWLALLASVLIKRIVR